MTSTIYLDTHSKVARAAMTGYSLPVVAAKLLSHLKLDIVFFDGADILDEVTNATCVIKPRGAPSGDPALIDTTAVLSGSGDTAKYVFEWASADSVQLRAVLDAAADPTLPMELRCEVEYELGGRVERVAFPILFENSYTRPEDPAPDATQNTSWETLKSRLVAGTNITRTVDDEARVITFSATSPEHTHDINDVDGLQSALDAKLPADDPSVTNARTPTGGAGGVLSGTFPNPGFAVDMATQAELNAVALAKADVSHSHADATTLEPGFMSAADKAKLNGIADGANNYVLPAPTATVMGGVKRNAGSAGQFVNGIDAGGNLTYGTPAAGSTISTPRVVYVASNGNDSTGVVGDPSKPFLTGTAGYTAGLSTLQNFSIEFGQGEYTIDLSGNGLSLGSQCRLLRGRGSNHDQLGMGTQVTINATAAAGGNMNGTNGGTVSVEIAHLHLIVYAQGQNITVNDENVYNAGSGGTIKVWGTGRVHAYANGGNLDTLWSGEQGAGGGIELRGVACDTFSVEPGSGPGMMPVLGSLWADGCDLLGASATLDTNSYLLRCSHNNTLAGHTDVGGNAIPW